VACLSKPIDVRKLLRLVQEQLTPSPGAR